MSKKRTATKIILVTFNILLILSLGLTSGYYFIKYRNLQTLNLTDDQKIAKYEKEISKNFTLPKDNKGILYTIKAKDSETVKKSNPTFFKDSSIDDVLLIYKDAPLVIIYRPSTKKIINSGPLEFTNKVSVTLVGSKADRLAVNTVLKQAFATTVSVSSEVEAKSPITAKEGTTVVDVTGKNTELAAKIAGELKGKVGNVPEGQEKPADTIGIAIYVSPAAPGL